jgi:hypothetical protein
MTDDDPWATTMGAMVLWSHDAALAARPVSVGTALGFICSRLGEQRLQYLSDDIRLVVSELATNATVYARTPFTVTLDGYHQSVVLSVQDGSTSIRAISPPSVMATGGRGLSIVDRMSREWASTTAGPQERKSVWDPSTCGSTSRHPSPRATADCSRLLQRNRT